MGVQFTQNQWFTKLRSFVPMRYTENEDLFTFVLWAVAKALSEVGAKVDESVADTFILRARDGTLDTHGAERSIDRINSYFRELDSPYSVRIQNFFAKSDVMSIKQVVDRILLKGVCEIREDFDADLFFDRDLYFNRGAITIDPKIINTFSILVDKQVHDPYSFYDREYFADREDFIGMAESSLEVFDLIQKVVDNAAALGTFYRIIERLE